MLVKKSRLSNFRHQSRNFHIPWSVYIDSQNNGVSALLGSNIVIHDSFVYHDDGDDGGDAVVDDGDDDDDECEDNDGDNDDDDGDDHDNYKSRSKNRVGHPRHQKETYCQQ